jgi:hypothetical protein
VKQFDVATAALIIASASEEASCIATLRFEMRGCGPEAGRASFTQQ